MKRYQKRRLEEQGIRDGLHRVLFRPAGVAGPTRESARAGEKNAQGPMMVVEPDDYLLNRRLQRYSDDVGHRAGSICRTRGFLNGEVAKMQSIVPVKNAGSWPTFYKWQRRATEPADGTEGADWWEVEFRRGEQEEGAEEVAA